MNLYNSIKGFVIKNRLMVILEIYLLLTLFVYIVGPFDYGFDNIIKVIEICFFYQISLLVGYYLVFRLDRKERKEHFDKSIFNLKFVVILTLLSIVINYLHISYIVGTFNPVKLLNVFINSILGLGDAYISNLERAKLLTLNGSVITKMVTLMSPILQISLVLGILLFVKSSLISKVLIIINFLVTFSVPVVKGQNFGFFSLIILLISIYFLRSTKGIVNMKRNIITIVISLSTFLLYFSLSTIGRLKPTIVLKTLFGVSINQKNWMFTITPYWLHNPIILISSYISQGYHGLSLALNERFTSALGFGNGYFALRIGRIFLGKDMFERTYISKISDQWHPQINWHTAYTWFANDVSFWGVPFVIILLGAGLYIVLKYAKLGNVIALSLLPLYIISILFLPMNNVILGNSTTAFQFVILNIVFFLTRSKNVYIGSYDEKRFFY